MPNECGFARVPVSAHDSSHRRPRRREKTPLGPHPPPSAHTRRSLRLIMSRFSRGSTARAGGRGARPTPPCPGCSTRFAPRGRSSRPAARRCCFASGSGGRTCCVAPRAIRRLLRGLARRDGRLRGGRRRVARGVNARGEPKTDDCCIDCLVGGPADCGRGGGGDGGGAGRGVDGSGGRLRGLGVGMGDGGARRLVGRLGAALPPARRRPRP